MFDPFLFDCRGFEVVRGAFASETIDQANAAIDELDVWNRISEAIDSGPRGVWEKTSDNIVKYSCVIGPGHIQVGPVAAWPEPISSLVEGEGLRQVLDQLFPEGHYVDHVSLSLAHAGAPGIGLHGGGFERDLRQGYRIVQGAWDVGLAVIIVSLVPSNGNNGGTAFVPGSHKATFAPVAPLPGPDDFEKTGWIVGTPLEAGDLVVFPEATMHGAFPWRNSWERRSLIVKAYPAHLANLNSRMRGDTEPFWREA